MFTRSRVTCSFSASLSACLRFRWYWVTNDGSSWRPISIPFAAWAGCGETPRSAAISADTSTAPSIRGRVRGRDVRERRKGRGATVRLLLSGACFDRTPVPANTPAVRPLRPVDCACVYSRSLTSSPPPVRSPAPPSRPRMRATYACVSGMAGTQPQAATRPGPALYAARASGTDAKRESRSCMRWPWASIEALGSNGLPRPYAAAVPEMPRLPLVPPDEPVALGVGVQPRVGRRRSQVELRPQPVQRAPGRGDPLRVGVASEQRRLLAVRAEGADDDEPDPGRCSAALHAIERERCVRPHRLALAICERAPVLTVAARDREGRAARGRGEARLGVGADAYEP